MITNRIETTERDNRSPVPRVTPQRRRLPANYLPRLLKWLGFLAWIAVLPQGCAYPVPTDAIHSTTLVAPSSPSLPMAQPPVTPIVALPTESRGETEVARTPAMITPTAQDVQVTTSSPSYALNEIIAVSISNNLPISIFGYTGQTYCTIVTVQQEVDDAWQVTQAECPLEAPSLPVEIPAHGTTLVAVFPRLPGDPRLEAGTYRIKFVFTAGAAPGPQNTVYSTPFTINHQEGTSIFRVFISFVEKVVASFQVIRQR
jgi:hypothetical protein